MTIYAKKKYCVYLTSYRGNLLPQFYIGSTSVERILRGYNGSVKSKKYKKIYDNERRNNPHLFKTFIVATYYSRKMCSLMERRLQTKLNVVKSTMYTNMSIARDFGWYGMVAKKEDSPVYGKRWKKTEEQKENCRRAAFKAFNKPEYKDSISKIRTGKLPFSKEQLTESITRYKNIISLYETAPPCDYGFVAKNGKVMTYERAFAKKYCDVFNMTPNGLFKAITDQNLIKKLL